METPAPGRSGPADGWIKVFPFFSIRLPGLAGIILFSVFCLFFRTALAQPVLRSSIRGTVVDLETFSPLPGATIILRDSDPLVGTNSDANGHFTLTGIPIGKHRIKVTYVGYVPYLSDALTVSSGRETDVTVNLQEAVIAASEVEIKGDYKKYGAINKMATVSVRPFSVDETFRFAGSYNDPARMAANFAGVTSGIDNRNDIIVRGNSPIGLQWRIDGMEIPNPNHFAAVGTTGGPVTVLNNNLLTNSDFFTGSFPADYGNAISGVFDMRMRTGNNEKHEYWFGIGWNGLEFGTEGPISKQSGASYLFSYRYSLLDILGFVGIGVDPVPHYQDINFKVSIPAKKTGVFTIEGIGGLSYIQLFDSRKNRSEWMFPGYGEDLSNGSNLGVIGISNQFFADPSLRIKNQLYFVASQVYTRIDSLNPLAQPTPWAGERSSENKFSYGLQIFKKFSAKNSIETGISLDYYDMNFSDSILLKGKFQKQTGSSESMFFLRGYGQWQHRFSDRFRSTTGIFGSRLFLNNTWAVEPRLGFDWLIDERHSLNFGAGMYSQMQPHVIYFILSGMPDGTFSQSNLNLDFSRCWETALGYNFLPSEFLHFKSEIYYQHLYDIPVKRSIPMYSLSNQGHEFFLDRQYSDSLINLGSGDNYGVEFTFERFLHKSYYFMFTSSFFNSTYCGYDGIERSSAFDVKYALNAVGGYELIIGKRRWGVMSFGLRATWAGGNPYIPFDVTATLKNGESTYDWQNSFEPMYPDYKRLSVRFGLKRNLPGYNLEFMLDLQYRTNYTNVYLQRINPKTGEIRNYFSMGFFPMATWRIQF